MEKDFFKFNRFFTMTIFLNSSLLRVCISFLMMFFISVSLSAKSSVTGFAHIEVTAQVQPTGSGSVYVSFDSGTTPNYEETSKAEKRDPATGDKEFKNEPSYDCHFYAKANSGYTLEKWVDGGSTQKATTDYTESIKCTKSDLSTKKSVSRIAVFKKIITVPDASQNVTLSKRSGQEASEQVEINLHNASNFQTAISRTGGSGTALITCTYEPVSGSGAKTSILTISTQEGVVSGDKFTITLTADNGAQGYIYVDVQAEVQISFLKPTVGQGSYTATREDGSGIQYTLSHDSEKSSEDVIMYNASECTYSVVANATTGYRFRRWVVQRTTGPVYFYGTSYQYKANNGESFTAEFIDEDCAQFILVGTENVYAHLEDAIAEAQRLDKTVISVYQSGSVSLLPVTDIDGNVLYYTIDKTNLGKSEWRLPRPTSGKYTIPTGYTLLVPGLNKSGSSLSVGYNSLVGKTTEDDFIGARVIPTSVCKLTVESRTTIEVNGNISIYSCLSASQGYNGSPTGYGQIHLGEDSHIKVKDGGVLHTLGYITGDPTTTSVVAESGSTVYEAFQVRDWRGASALLGGNLINNSNEVFPIGQYYIQNIETMLELQCGAKENVTVAFDITGAGIIPITTTLIDKKTSGEDICLFALGENTKLTKYYEVNTDRLKIKLIGLGSGKEVKLSYLYFSLNTFLGDYSLDTRNYVLPINNNIDIEFDNLKMDVPYKFVFMAGSSLKVNSNSQFNIKNELYLYDAELNVQPANVSKGYYASTCEPLMPIAYTAFHNGAPDMRRVERSRYPEKLQDAKFVIDGTLTMEGSGVLYTTTDGRAITDGVDEENKPAEIYFGANITSENSGVIEFKSVGTKETTNQIEQNDRNVAWVTNIPVCNAWLRNRDGSRVGGIYVGHNYTYKYIDGTWTKVEVGLKNIENNDFGTITLPESIEKDVICEVMAVGVGGVTISKKSTEGTGFGVGNISKEGNSLTIPVTYTPSNVHNTQVNGKIVLTISYTNPVSGKTTSQDVEIPLSVVENYTPEFTVTIDETPITNNVNYSLGTTTVGTPISKTVVITPKERTVAQKLASAGWTASVEVPFIFVYGTPSDIPFDNILKYSPTEGGSQSGVLTLTATYKDENQTEVPYSFTINLSGSANKLSSSLQLSQDFILDNGIYKCTIFQGQTIEQLFENNTGNGNDITFNVTGNDNGLVGIQSNDKNYRLEAKENEGVEDPQTITIVATQPADGAMEGKTFTIELTVLPAVTWNWGTLYFNSITNVAPITTSSGDEWILIVKEGGDPQSLITSLEENQANGYVATIDAPQDLTETYIVTFLFTMGGKQREFTSEVYADPRILPYCVGTERTYNDVAITKASVAFDDATDAITFAPNGILELEMKGQPNTLTFTSNGDNAWRVMERVSSSEAWSSVVQWTNSFVNGQVQTLRLKPTTRFVRIDYGNQTQNAGIITNLCISKLDIVADVDKLYLPIGAEKQIVLTHSEATTPTITLGEPLLYTTETSNNLGTEEEPYYTTTVTVNGATAEETYEFSAVQGNCTINVDIRTYTFPQELPIKWIEDAAERYYFETVDSRYAQWNETNKTLLFQNPGSPLTRSVTFAFNGAPSVISFDLSKEVDDSEWEILESVDGIAFEHNDIGRDTEVGNRLTHQLDYRTRYVRVLYKSNSTSEVILSNLVIEGYPMAWAEPEELSLSVEQRETYFRLNTINLQNIKVVLDNDDFVMQHGVISTEQTSDGSGGYVETTKFEVLGEGQEFTLGVANYPDALGTNKVGEIIFKVIWQDNDYVNQGKIKVYNILESAKLDLLTTIKIVGFKETITPEDPTSGINTGIAKGYTSSIEIDYEHHEVDVTNAFATDGTALFDYLIIYGETKTIDDTKDITSPTSEKGSNALTPYYVYEKVLNNETGKYDSYRFVDLVENANMPNKAVIDGVTTTDEGSLASIYVGVEGSLKVYMTGFCPYATTGSTSGQEGVWFFRGENGETLDIYLEDCYIYSRNKTENGISMSKEDSNAPFFEGDIAFGSGGVLVFENTERWDNSETKKPFKVNIHTIGKNVLKSNFGSFYKIFGMRAYQISAPLHIHMNSLYHVDDSKTELTLDDIWPRGMDSEGNAVTERTNGFLSLQKQSNNAPSIDLGNPYSVVNFKGGQVELENAQIVSPNYKTTLAISYRSGKYGADDLNLRFAYGIGTDDAEGGTVNFYDGTTTVKPMEVDAEYRQYYLMDKDEQGNELTTTSCLRCPRNTFVYGGSQCFMRACSHVTSKGGAPTDGYSQLGQYVYEFDEANDVKDENGLVTQMSFPNGIETEDGIELSSYYKEKGYTPQWSSVTPDKDGKIYFWIPDGYGGVDAEEDKLLTTWKACMTRIEAGYMDKSGGIGGETFVELNEEVKYLLYCQLDENIHSVISASKGEGDNKTYSYSAPVKVPDVAQEAVGSQYIPLNPTLVGANKAEEITSEIDYTITDKVYYVTTATADVWMTFTAPFDVAKIWVVETYDETALAQTPIKTEIVGNQTTTLTKRQSVLREQAKHNADFAAFFGVAMALGSTDNFEKIYNDWRTWGFEEDTKDPEGDAGPLYTGTENNYNLRGKYELTPYIGGNWQNAHFYLNHNTGPWELVYGDNYELKFIPQWETLTAEDLKDDILLHKGETYSMLFPYCVGCWEKDGTAVKERADWDYWSGKFLIFESTPGGANGHTIKGANYVSEDNSAGVFAGADEVELIGWADVRGNSTFSFMTTSDDCVLSYSPAAANESFVSNDNNVQQTILPTTSFLITNWGEDVTSLSATKVKSITRMGKINYASSADDNGGTPTGGEHVPTVGGGSDIFVTSVAEGINIAVSEPQYVGVFSATGALLYNGWVETSVDVNLVVNGVYVVVGENESVKIIY